MWRFIRRIRSKIKRWLGIRPNSSLLAAWEAESDCDLITLESSVILEIWSDKDGREESNPLPEGGAGARD